MPKEETPKKKIFVEEVAETPKVKEEVKPLEDTEKSTLLPDKSEETPPTENKESSNNHHWLPWVLLPIFTILGGLLGGFIGYQIAGKQLFKPLAPLESPNSSAEPSSSLAPAETKVDLQAFKINIQNGSGIGGEGAKAQALLETAGFNVSKTANADSYDYTSTIIKAKDSVNSNYLDKLELELAKKYDVRKGNILSENETADVIVIVGKSKAKSSSSE